MVVPFYFYILLDCGEIFILVNDVYEAASEDASQALLNYNIEVNKEFVMEKRFC